MKPDFYENLFKNIYLLLILFFPALSYPQQPLRGRVFDLNSNETLSGVTISFADSSKGTTSDAKGYFEIEFHPEFKIQHLGYQTRQIKVGQGEQFLSIGLQSESFELNEIVVSAYRNERKRFESPGALAVITFHELHRDNEVNIAPALNRVPGVYMHNGTFNTNRIVIRGVGSRSLFSTNKIRAYLDEIPLSTGEGETTIEDLDLSVLGRVEILKGPASSLYGAGLGGTILLQSLKADPSQSELRNETLRGDFGLWRNVSSLKTASAKTSFHFLHSYNYSDSYRENNRFDRRSIAALAQFYGAEDHTFSVLALLTSSKSFIPSSVDSLTFATNPRAAASNWLNAQGFEDYQKLILGISHHFLFQKNWELKTALFGSFRNADEPRPFNILKEANQIYGLRSLLSFNKDLSLSFQLKWIFGLEFFKENYAWQTYQNNNRLLGVILSDQEEERSFYNAFSQVDVAVKKWFFSAGINLNSTLFNINDSFLSDGIDQSGKYSFKQMFSPRLALNYRMHPHLNLFATAAQGFSMPSVDETLTPEGLFNPDIQPETGWNLEGGVRFILLRQRLFVEAVYFYLPIRNLLVSRRTAEDAFIGVNAGKTINRGLEIAINGQILKKENAHSLQVFANATLASYQFRNFIDGDNDFSGNQLTGVPRHTLNAGLDWESKLGFYGHINYLWIDRMPILDDNSLYSEAYGVMNLKFGFRRKAGKLFHFNLFGGIQNLLDEKYASMLQINATGTPMRPPRYYYPGLPRNFFGGISLAIRWEKV